MTSSSQDVPENGDNQANPDEPQAGAADAGDGSQSAAPSQTPEGAGSEVVAREPEAASGESDSQVVAAEAADVEAGAAEAADVEAGGEPAESTGRRDGRHRGEEKSGAPLVCVRYGRMGMLGLFGSKLGEIAPHARVVIKSDRGLELGVALCPATRRTTYAGKPLKRVGLIRRLATGDDLMEERHLHQSEERERTFCSQRIKELKLPMRLATVEHVFGGDRIVFFFLSDGRVDFRNLVKDLAHEYQTRIEMRQIGVRDEARLLADYERCGQFVCCRTFIKDFQPVSMRMAKIQKATLDPSKISGRCGRLMCCLRYEFQTYEELRKNLPKKNSYVMTEESGPGKVVGSDILTQLVKVDISGRVEIVSVESITQRDLTEKEVSEWFEAKRKEMSSRGSRRGGAARRPREPREARPEAKASEASEPEAGSDKAESRNGEAVPQADSGSPEGQRPPRRRSRGSRGRRRGKRPGTEGAESGGPAKDDGQGASRQDGGQGASRQGGGARDRQSRRGDVGLPKKVLEDLGVEDTSDTSGVSQGGEGRTEGSDSEAEKKRHRSHRGRRRSKRKKSAGGSGESTDQGTGPGAPS